MTAVRIAWHNLWFRPILTLVTAATVASAVGLAVAISTLTGAVETALVRASQPFDLLVAAKGSPTAVIMSTILLQEAPVGNIPFALYEHLRADPRVAHAVPLALGDSVSGYRIIGVGPEFYTLVDPKTRQPYFRLAAGRLPEREFEAVAGAQLAARTSLTLGAEFQSQHGLIPGSITAHRAYYRIVGVLQASDTPFDRAVFVPLASYWLVHDHHDHAAGHEDDDAAAPTETSSQGPEREITVALIRPQGIREFYQLHQEINRSPNAQAILVGQGMQELFDRLAQDRQVLVPITYLTLAMASATVFLTSYTLGSLRRRETAVLRALGAARGAVFVISLLEPLLVTLGGALAGAGLGFACAWLIAEQLSETRVLPLHPAPTPDDGAIVLVTLGLALLAGLVPALTAYRQEVAAHLNTA